MICGNTSDFIYHPLHENFVSAHGASHHAWASGPPPSKSGTYSITQYINLNSKAMFTHKSPTTTGRHLMNYKHFSLTRQKTNTRFIESVKALQALRALCLSSKHNKSMVPTVSQILAKNKIFC